VRRAELVARAPQVAPLVDAMRVVPVAEATPAQTIALLEP